MKQSAESSELKNPAWSKQSFLKEERIPTIKEIIGMAESVEKDRDRALFVLAYLTAGRIREIVRNKEKPSIRKNDLEIKDVNGRQVLLINMRNQKNREKKRKDLEEQNIEEKFKNIIVKTVINSLQMTKDFTE